MMTTSKKPLKSASRGVFEISIAETSRLLPILGSPQNSDNKAR